VPGLDFGDGSPRHAWRERQTRLSSCFSLYFAMKASTPSIHLGICDRRDAMMWAKNNPLARRISAYELMDCIGTLRSTASGSSIARLLFDSEVTHEGTTHTGAQRSFHDGVYVSDG